MRTIMLRPFLAVLWVGLAAFAARADTPDARTELDAAIALLKAHHMNAAAIAWPTVEDHARAMLGGATKADGAYSAIEYVIGQLGEKHTTLRSAALMEAQRREAAVAGTPPPYFQPPEGMILAGGIGYLTLRTYEGSPRQDILYAHAARQAIARFAAAHVCRIIVDLRH